MATCYVGVIFISLTFTSHICMVCNCCYFYFVMFIVCICAEFWGTMDSIFCYILTKWTTPSTV